MKSKLLVCIVLCSLLFSACGSDQRVEKGEVLVDQLKLASTMEVIMPVEIGSVEFGSSYGENLLEKSEWAFQYFLNMPENEEFNVMSIAYQNAKQMEVEWERLDEGWVEEITNRYPDALSQGYYLVTKMSPGSQQVVSGKFLGTTQMVLELTNPFWKEGLVGEPMNRKAMEELARAFVVDKKLLGDVQEPVLKAQYRYWVPEEETEWFWFRYENPDVPENQVLMVMRNDSTAFISFHSGYMAMVVQNETERFAERIEIE